MTTLTHIPDPPCLLTWRRPGKTGCALVAAIASMLTIGNCAQAQRVSAPTIVSTETESVTGRESSVARILKTFCIDCHNDQEPDGSFNLKDFDLQAGADQNLEVWRMIYERVRFGEMPPESALQPNDAKRTRLLKWFREKLLTTQLPGGVIERTLRLPKYGNYIDHAALFDRDTIDTMASRSSDEDVVIPAPPRLWRLRPQSYASLHSGNAKMKESDGLNEPLALVSRTGFKDYASLYFIDEPTTGLLLSNAKKIVQARSQATLAKLTQTGLDASDDVVESAIRETFRKILLRAPTKAETRRFSTFHSRVSDAFGLTVAAEQLLTAIYMQPEALFREELGAGPPDEYGRIRLSQQEIALAVSYALGDGPDQLLVDAAGRSELKTREQLLSHVRRRFDSPPQPAGNPRVLEFFREYFNYPHAIDVFKNRPKRGSHQPHLLVADLDLLIARVVQKDEDVLFNLLTTNEYFVDCRIEPQSGALEQASVGLSRDDAGFGDLSEYASVYGLPRDWFWTDSQPVKMPSHMRAGVLTHPAWLAAWSGNSDNHPIQRGKWIRTHLLGGTIPDVPIGVDAVIPDDRHRQLRERLVTATAGAECQRCHRKMDTLGLPFEQFDHYGRFRIRELDRPVKTSGTIAFVEGGAVSGHVRNSLDLTRQLAGSEYVEQVFVRHVFRFFMGRNETLGDAKTLREAHRAYRRHRGSFRALVESLLTSDSFLLRRVSTESENPDSPIVPASS